MSKNIAANVLSFRYGESLDLESSVSELIQILFRDKGVKRAKRAKDVNLMIYYILNMCRSLN